MNKDNSHAPPWYRGGNQVDHDHPFIDILLKLTALSAAFTRAFKTEQGKVLLQALTDVAKLKVATRFLAYSQRICEDGDLFGGTAKFVGFHALRDLVKKAGKSSRPLTPTWLRKAFLEATEATEEAMLEEGEE